MQVSWAGGNMKKFAAIAAIPLLAGCLMAQSQTETTTTTTKTNTWDGSLVDQGCYTTHVQQKDSSAEGNTSTQTETNKYVTECPVTTTSTSFGMITSDGKFVRFDDAGNTRIVEMVKSNKDWNNYITGKKPVKVRVIGSENGGTVVIKEIH
jgi:hypothetical protein